MQHGSGTNAECGVHLALTFGVSEAEDVGPGHDRGPKFRRLGLQGMAALGKRLNQLAPEQSSVAQSSYTRGPNCGKAWFFSITVT